MLSPLAGGMLGPLATARGAAGGVYSDGLVAYWRLDEQSGARADQTGSYGLSEEGGSIGYAAGHLRANAALFAGAAAHLRTSGTTWGSAGVGKGKERSVSLWWYPTDNLTARRCICGVGASYPDGTPLWLINGGPNLISMFLGGGYRDFAVTVSMSTWHHIVWTWDKTNNRVYLDGALVGSPLAQAEGTDNSSIFYVGGDYALRPVGRVEALAVFSRVLSAADVTTLWNVGNGLDH